MAEASAFREYRIGFILSHPFHYLIYRPLIEKLDSAVLIIEKRRNTPFEFSADFLSGLGREYIVIDENDIGILDHQFDVIFLMTPKHLQGNFSRAKTVVTQYGMAKEVYNYGLWRCLGDLNLMYGNYSHNMIKGHAVSQPVGNLRLDGYKAPSIGGGGVLYLPTYGDLSTLLRFEAALPSLNKEVPITIKLHHASEFADTEIVRRFQENPRVRVLDGYSDAFDEICRADVVISDYSGAIFDALFLDRPVVLYQPGFTQNIKRTDDDSIEIARAHEFGPVLKTDEDLICFFDSFATGNIHQVAPEQKNEFLSNPGNSVPAVLHLLEELLNGRIRPNIVQMSIRSTYKKLLHHKNTPEIHIVGFQEAVKKRLTKIFRRQ